MFDRESISTERGRSIWMLGLMCLSLLMGCATGAESGDPEDSSADKDFFVTPDIVDDSTPDTTPDLKDTTDMSTMDMGTMDMTTMDMGGSDMVTFDGMLGQQCGIDLASGCVPDTTGWPSCANIQCNGDPCLMLFDDIGYCSLSGCTTDSDCNRISPSSVVGADFKCVRGGASSYCMPGSNQPCTTSSTCAAGEVCKFGFVSSGSTLTSGTTCQTATTNGQTPGATCNTNPAWGAINACATAGWSTSTCRIRLTANGDLSW